MDVALILLTQEGRVSITSQTDRQTNRPGDQYFGSITAANTKPREAG